MKKIILLLTFVFAVLSAHATVKVCDSFSDENGHFDSPYITRGSITWDSETKTLTLDNAVVEYYTDNVYDGVRPLTVNEDATIVIHGECKLLTNGHSALNCQSYSTKNISIIGDGSLYTSSTWIDIFIYCTHLTIKDIYLETVNGIAENGNGVHVALTFDYVQANIKGEVGRIGDGITFRNCSITYPEDAYIGHTDVGDFIYYGNEQIARDIIISRDGNIPGGLTGDLDGSGMVDVEDVNAAINIILKLNTMADYPGNGDMDGNGMIDVEDVNAMINIILKL